MISFNYSKGRGLNKMITRLDKQKIESLNFIGCVANTQEGLQQSTRVVLKGS